MLGPMPGITSNSFERDDDTRPLGPGDRRGFSRSFWRDGTAFTITCSPCPRSTKKS